MSMIGRYAEISAAQLEALQKDPDQMLLLLAGRTSLTRPLTAALLLAPASCRGLTRRRLLAMLVACGGVVVAGCNRTAPRALRGQASPPAIGRPVAHLDVEKMWQALHFTLTGSAEGGTPPLSYVVLGGVELGPDVGYGAARVLTPAKVAQAHAALQAITPDAFGKRFDPQALARAHVYPDVWTESADSLRAEVQEAFVQVAAFFEAAARRNDAVVFWVS